MRIILTLVLFCFGVVVGWFFGLGLETFFMGCSYGVFGTCDYIITLLFAVFFGVGFGWMTWRIAGSS
ncbi:hypothetical protein [Parasulfitobacter algicola]|uniref:Uncharacterized protein n=1 Tax=Parasulfitobacter algicola TaxID=2614809 RepID=A0ABX2ISU0_9RHOB|nr:hypothetical protein [Sulfitobacter algicola]NSX54145.1 hypothetical protein [Sulfitobacter algicola]